LLKNEKLTFKPDQIQALRIFGWQYVGRRNFWQSQNFAQRLILLRLGKNSNFRSDHYHKKVIFFLMGVLRNSNNFVILFPGIKQVDHSSIMICSIAGTLVKSFRFFL